MICSKVCLIALLGVGAALARAADVEQAAPAASPAPGQFDNLIKNSPFGQAALPGAQPGGDGSSLEFRGVFVDKGEYFFSVHEPSTRTSRWVGMKEAGQPFLVESYDAEKGTVQIKYRNQVTALTMKRSQVVVQAMPVAAPPQPQVAMVGGPTVTAGTPASADEAARMAQVAEEIRRRRALRAPPGNLPQPAPTGAPAIGPGRPVTPPTTRP